MKKFMLLLAVSVALASSFSEAKVTSDGGETPPRKAIQYELREDEYLNIVLSKHGSPMDYYVSKGEDVNRQILALDRGNMGRNLYTDLERGLEILGALRMVQEAVDRMPLAADLPPLEIKSKARHLAVDLAILLTESRFLSSKLRVVQDDLAMSLTDYLGNRFHSLVQTLHKPLVYPKLNSYLSGLKAAHLDKATRKFFWQNLAQRLGDGAPEAFRASNETEKIYLLATIMNSALMESATSSECEAALGGRANASRIEAL